MRPWMLGLLAVAALASLGGSRRVLGYARRMRRRKPAEDTGMMEEDIQRFVGEGGTPLGAGAE